MATAMATSKAPTVNGGGRLQDRQANRATSPIHCEAYSVPFNPKQTAKYKHRVDLTSALTRHPCIFVSSPPVCLCLFLSLSLQVFYCSALILYLSSPIIFSSLFFLSFLFLFSSPFHISCFLKTHHLYLPYPSTNPIHFTLPFHPPNLYNG